MLRAVSPIAVILTIMFAIAIHAVDFQIVDLTHDHGPDVVYWPIFPTFNFTVLYRNRTEEGFWLEYNSFATAEHSGTHIDAPCHFAENGLKVHEIPLNKLVGPGVIVNVKSKAAANADYKVSLDDLKAWEDKHKKIPDGAIVIMNSGWSQKFPNKTLVFGSENHTDTSTFHFPGWHEDAIDWLLSNRNVHVVGVDTPSPDDARSTTHPVHQMLTAASIPIIENAANLDSIPESGTIIYVAAFKLYGGSGSPTRVFATVMTGDAASNLSSKCLMILMVLFYGFCC